MKRILFLLAAYTGLGLSMQYLLPTEQLLLDNLTQTISLNKAEEVLAQMMEYRWVGYALTPVLLLIKWLFVAGLLYTALFFSQVPVSFKSLWRIALQSEWVFVLAALIKFCWFYFFATNYTLQDLQFFYPLSAANLFTPDELEAWWVYPFQIINLFEVTYWVVLAILLGKLIQVSTDKAFEYVAKGYGTGLLLWVLLIVFITLNYSF
jgi:hypothetical protein